MNKPADIPADVIVEAIPIGSIALSSTHYQEQRRKHFKQEALLELAASIRQIGVQQPIVVRPISLVAGMGNNKTHEIVFGERRMIAADRAGNAHVPCIVRELNDEAVILAQLTENKQREDDNPLAEAEGYADLKKLKGYDADKIGELIGKSRSYVFARLKLLDLCSEAREALATGAIDYSKALLIARFAPKLQPKALKTISGDYVTARNAFSYLRNGFMADLNAAPFSVIDPRDGVQVGPQKFTWAPRTACDACPSNSRNDAELGLDDDAHVCTDKPCFDLKVQAYWAEKKAEAEGAGCTVLSGDEAKGAVPHIHIGYNDRYVRLDAECDEVDLIEDETTDYNAPLPKYRELLADAKLTPVLAQTADGLVELVPVAEAAKALKKKGITLHVPEPMNRDADSGPIKTPAELAAEKKRDDELHALELEYRSRLFRQIHATFKGPLKRPDLERIAAVTDEGTYLHNSIETLVDELLPQQSDWHKASDTDLVRYIALMNVATDIDPYATDKPSMLLELAQRFKIDAKKIRADVVRDLKPVSAPKEEEPADERPAVVPRSVIVGWGASNAVGRASAAEVAKLSPPPAKKKAAAKQKTTTPKKKAPAKKKPAAKK